MLPRILIVDDVESNLYLLEKFIEGLSVEVDSCSIPTDVEPLINEYVYSLIILDIQMPDLDGFDLAMIIRNSELNEHTPIIFLTGVFNDNESIIKAYEYGAIDFITKPVNRVVLVSKIKIFLKMFNQKTELHKKSVLLEKYITKLKKTEKKRIKYLIEGEDQERERISRDLHDGLGQYLSAATLNFGSILEDIKLKGDDISDRFEAGCELLRKAIDESRSLTRKLIPGSVNDFGLAESVKSLVKTLEKTTDIKIRFNTNLSQKRLSKNLETNFYRVSQECLNNAIKHSKASEIVLQIFLHDQLISLTYEDNGVGFDVDDKVSDSYGLQIMNNRTQLLNGSMQIDSSVGKGTFICIEVPIENI